jgi:hypothetical protein
VAHRRTGGERARPERARIAHLELERSPLPCDTRSP